MIRCRMRARRTPCDAIARVNAVGEQVVRQAIGARVELKVVGLAPAKLRARARPAARRRSA